MSDTEQRITAKELLNKMGYSVADNIEGYDTAFHWKSKIAGGQTKNLYKYKSLLETMGNASILGPLSMFSNLQNKFIENSLTNPIEYQARIAALTDNHPDIFIDANEKIETLYAALLYDFCGYFLKFGHFDQEKAIYASTAPTGKEFLENKLKEFAWLESQYNSLGLTKLSALRELLKSLVIAVTETPIEGDEPFMSYNKDGTPALDFQEYLQEIRTRLELLYKYNAFDIQRFSERATGEKIGYSEYEIVEGSIIYMASLRHYFLPEGTEPNGKVVYMVSPLINMPEIFDLAQEKSVVEGMLHQGYTIYMVDYGNPDIDQTVLGLDFYGKLIHDKYLDLIKQRHPDQEILVLGYCIGGTLMLPYLARRAEERFAAGENMDIKKVALMASPAKFDDVESGQYAMRETIREEYDADLVNRLFGEVNVPAKMIESGMNEIQPGVRYQVAKGFYKRATSAKNILDSAPFLYWLTHGRKFPCKAHQEWIQNIFMGNQIYEDSYCLSSTNKELDGKPVDMDSLAKAQVALFDYRGTRDPISPPGSCVASETWGMLSKASDNTVPSQVNWTIEKNIGHIFVVSKKFLFEYLKYLNAFFRGESLE